MTGAGAAIRAGGIVAYPTEGVWGLGCNPADGEAVRRLLALKGRPADKGLILLAADFDQLTPWIAPLDAATRRRLEATWPGPVTWIVRAARDCPPWLTGGRDTVAVRVTAHPPARELALAAGTALVSTSANPTGEPPLASAAAIRERFGTALEAVVDAPLGGLSGPTEIREAPSGRVIRPAARGAEPG